MGRLAFLSFARTVAGARARVIVGEDCWTADYPTLEDAIFHAFVNDLVDSEEACDALATERHMVPWRKPLYVKLSSLKELGFERERILERERRA